jgi:hypothetical protein
MGVGVLLGAMLGSREARAFDVRADFLLFVIHGRVPLLISTLLRRTCVEPDVTRRRPPRKWPVDAGSRSGQLNRWRRADFGVPLRCQNFRKA